MNRKMRRTFGLLLSFALVVGMAAQAMAVTLTLPLMNNTRWGQGNASASQPYNLYAPLNGTEHTTAGWLATAVGQIFNYYGWPTLGTGTITAYTSGGITVPAVSLTTTTTTGRPYLMSNASAMAPLMLNASTNSKYTQSIARMLADIGAAFGTTYRNATYHGGQSNARSVGSFINGSLSAAPFTANFYYKNTAQVVYGKDYGPGRSRGSAWMRLIEGEVNAGRPVIVRLGNDSNTFSFTDYPKNYIFVVDGYDKNANPPVAHINWGNGSNTNMGWYKLNYTSQLPAHLRWGGANVTNMSAIIGIAPKYTNVTLLNPVNASTSSSHPDSDIPKTPYLGGPFRFSGGAGASNDYNYYEITLASPGQPISAGALQYWPSSYCNATTHGSNICTALLHPSVSWTTGVYQWRVRGLYYNASGNTATYGGYSTTRKFNATMNTTLAQRKAVRLRTPNGSISANPTAFTWFRVPGASYYKLELFKGTEVLNDAVVGATGHPAIQQWYNASGPGNSNASLSAWGGQDVDCNTDKNICSLPMSAIANGGSLDLTVTSTTAHTGLGNYFWRVTPFGAGVGPSNSTSFFMNGTNAPTKAPTISCPHAPDVRKPGAYSSLAARCNVTSASPIWGWTDTTTNANDAYEIAYGPAANNPSTYFRAFILRNSSKFQDFYTGIAYKTLPNATSKVQTGPCDGNHCNASIGTTSVAGSILTGTGMHRLYMRGWNKDASNNFQSGDWANFTFYVATPGLGKVANKTPNSVALTRGNGQWTLQDRQMFYPQLHFNGARNASWYGVEFSATPTLSTTRTTFIKYFSKREICNASDTGSTPRCYVNATTVSNATAYYGLVPSFSYNIYSFAPGHVSDISSFKSGNTTAGSSAMPGVPASISPVSYSSTPGSYSWNSSLRSGNATYFEMYICKKAILTGGTVATLCPYHDFIPVDNSNYAATNNTVTRTSAFHGTTAAAASVSGNSWVYTVTVPDSNMSKGSDSGAPWTAGQYIWGVRGINPNGYNAGSGFAQFGLGNFTK